MADGIDLKDLVVDAKVDDDNSITQQKEADIREAIKGTGEELKTFSQELEHDLATELNEKLADGTLKLEHFMKILGNAQQGFESGEKTEWYINTHSLPSEKLALQVVLKKLGYYDGEIEADYGPQTIDAVGRYQEAYNLYIAEHAATHGEFIELELDSMAGPLTLKALQAVPVTSAGDLIAAVEVQDGNEESPAWRGAIETPETGWSEPVDVMGADWAAKVGTVETNTEAGKEGRIRFTPTDKDAATDGIALQRDENNDKLYTFSDEDAGIQYELTYTLDWKNIASVEKTTKQQEIKLFDTDADENADPDVNWIVYRRESLLPDGSYEYSLEHTVVTYDPETEQPNGTDEVTTPIELWTPVELEGDHAFVFAETTDHTWVYVSEDIVTINASVSVEGSEGAVALIPATKTRTQFREDGTKKWEIVENYVATPENPLLDTHYKAFDASGERVVDDFTVIPATDVSPEYSMYTMKSGVSFDPPQIRAGNEILSTTPASVDIGNDHWFLALNAEGQPVFQKIELNLDVRYMLWNSPLTDQFAFDVFPSEYRLNGGHVQFFAETSVTPEIGAKLAGMMGVDAPAHAEITWQLIDGKGKPSLLWRDTTKPNTIYAQYNSNLHTYELGDDGVMRYNQWDAYDPSANIVLDATNHPSRAPSEGTVVEGVLWNVKWVNTDRWVTASKWAPAKTEYATIYDKTTETGSIKMMLNNRMVTGAWIQEGRYGLTYRDPATLRDEVYYLRFNNPRKSNDLLVAEVTQVPPKDKPVNMDVLRVSDPIV